MKTQKQIKDDYAIKQGFANWYELITYCNEKYLDHYITEVMKIYAMECLKLATYNVDYEYTFLYGSERNVGDKVARQIANEINIIK